MKQSIAHSFVLWMLIVALGSAGGCGLVLDKRTAGGYEHMMQNEGVPK